MERDPGSMKPTDDDLSSDADEDAKLDAWLESLPPAPGILHIDDEDEEGDARAMEDYAAGRYHSHEVVGRWLMTWGKPGRKPFKEWLAGQHD